MVFLLDSGMHGESTSDVDISEDARSDSTSSIGVFVRYSITSVDE